MKSKAEIITFDEFIAYGLKHTDNIVDGMPWSFDYKGHAITHENDKCYLVPTEEGMMEFTPKHVLHVDINGNLYPHEIYVETIKYIDWNKLRKEFFEECACEYGGKLVHDNLVDAKFIPKQYIINQPDAEEIFDWFKSRLKS